MISVSKLQQKIKESYKINLFLYFTKKVLLEHFKLTFITSRPLSVVFNI